MKAPLLQDRQQLYREDPWKLQPIWLRPCHVRILMVTDGSATFGTANFGLQALLDALATPPGWWATFDITKAHRGADGSADLQNFRFDAQDLSPYDEIWMFAVQRSNGLFLTDNELKVIAQFMDGGGGVFATGDHEDLGVAMCGRIPRVRSMRMWHWPDPGPNGEPVAPNVGGENRYDTLREGNDPDFQFNDQSDDIPQRIYPRRYSNWPWTPWFYRWHPHPVLCGPRGVIRVLPDHPHEGECYEPSDLTASFTFSGYTTAEYPGGVAPEVIAWSTVTGRTVDADKGPVNGRTFGAIGAYDGFRANVGRVVVDATWHHFFDINLIGELGNPDPIKGVGFPSTPGGQAAFEDIKSYYRNIAVWLARPATHDCMWWRSLWWLRWYHRIVMDVRPPYLKALDRLDLPELIRLGSEARDALGRIASQCNVRWWIWWVVLRRFHREFPKDLGRYLDPWEPRPKPKRGPEPDPVPDLALPIHVELLFDAVLGALVYSVAHAFPNASEEARSKAEKINWHELTTPHVARAVRLVSEQMGRSAEGLRELEGLLGRGREEGTAR